MNNSPDFTYIFGRAVRYLSIRPRSVSEMHNYFVRKGFETETSEAVIEVLLKDKFLDDHEFAAWWVRGRKARGKADFVIKRELEEKGVEKELITEVMGENQVDDLSVAVALVERNKKKYAKYSQQEYNAKMGAFLARRGFSWEIIRKALTA